MTTTRFLFILFLLLNVLFFAVLRGCFGLGSLEEQSGVSIELNPERVKILGPVSTPENAQANTPASPDQEPEKPVCLAWGGLSTAQNNRLISLFSAAGIQAATREVQVPSSWRVRVPPLPTREAAEILTDNIVESGVDRSSIQIEDAGNDKFVIVIGDSFRSRQSAERYFETIKSKGVNASIETRNTAERRVEATVDKKKAEELLSGQPFARRYKPCSP
ncbi:MAG: hypothetical protein FWH56_03440 [Betaproteobacteria bacterium]|nr:hypothetical protein [Betaproteobacteria bacterium]